MKKSTRIMALIIAILMAASLMSTFALAEETQEPTAQDLPGNTIYYHLGLNYQGLTSGQVVQVEIPALGEGLYNVTYGVNAVGGPAALGSVANDGDTVYFGPGEQWFKDSSYAMPELWYSKGYGSVPHNLHYKGYYAGLNYVNPVTNPEAINPELETKLTPPNGWSGNSSKLVFGRKPGQEEMSFEGMYFYNTNIQDGDAYPLNISVKGCKFTNPLNYSTDGAISLVGKGTKNVTIDECFFESSLGGQLVNIAYGNTTLMLTNCSFTTNNSKAQAINLFDAPNVNILNNTFNAIGANGERYFLNYYPQLLTAATKVTGTVNIKNNTLNGQAKDGFHINLANVGGDTASDKFTVNVMNNTVIKGWGLAAFRFVFNTTVNAATTTVNINKNRFETCNYPLCFDNKTTGQSGIVKVTKNYFVNVSPSGVASASNNFGTLDLTNNYFGVCPSETMQYGGTGNTYTCYPFYIDEAFTTKSNVVNYTFNNALIPDLDTFAINDYNNDTFDFGITTDYKNTISVTKNGKAVDVNAPVDNGVNNYVVKISSFDGTASKTINATITKPILPKLSVGVTGSGSVTYGKDVIDSSAVYDNIPMGTEVTLSAEAVGNGEFLYWKDAVSGKVVSETPEYTFVSEADTSLVAVFTTGEANTRLVTYKNTNGAIIKSEEVAEGASIEVPADPYAYGYTFVKWSMTEEEVAQAAGNVEVVAVYKTASVYYSVNVTSGSISYASAPGIDENEGKYKQLSRVIVAPDDAAEGTKFAYWKDAASGEILNYNKFYDFFITEDTSVEAVYVNEAEEVAPAILTSITSSTVDSANSKITFIAERFVPEGNTVVSHGIILTSNARIGSDADLFVIGGTDVLKGTASTKGLVGKYSLTKKNVAASATWYARAYVVTVDEMGTSTITYSDAASATL